ncbi:sigma-54-dependent transcriptional regulator [Desulfosporosinus nitroreducens]|uniref:Stage 0 sporulation protein A homolog n=1 Tax=Desulfosporosinus nitroreducens TaxID=2018668 RepID=A0ABT8QPQ2_9FIRM|nr:sigma-54 dependent transcriptional regulator [Desulfosporosinus nitroreducens]MCO1601783.1 sigma-54 dependent transcriptional regulator [Desulfosporosinus nitroreducens]MDO0823326.1 sigma-54 dependent transcriptional regulator [Desulfosporosinus nitroreducens]
MKEERTILVIDDEKDMLEICSRIIKRMGYRSVTFNDSVEALNKMLDITPDLIITDLQMPGVDGFRILEWIKENLPETLVVVITGFSSIDSAIIAMKNGAFDYLPKPFKLDQLQFTITKAFQQIELKAENQLLRNQLQEVINSENLIGANGGLQTIFKQIGKIAKTNVTTLILGESGTGKELIAHTIHKNSHRSIGPFIPIDCASLPENLLESELFGYERGAFTGANRTKEGLFELASGGTLFLDEIGELSLALQAKLLRALEEKEFRRVGGHQLIKVDVRIVAATNRDLEQMVASKEFREDLYYRLNVISLQLPPLRERKEDIPLFVLHFCAKFARKTGKVIKGCEPRVMELLTQYSWPGNVRELRNIMERAVTLAENEVVGTQDLVQQVLEVNREPMKGNEISTNLPYREAKELWMNHLEAHYLPTLLDRFDGNITRAAEWAGIDRKTIHRLLKKHHLSRIAE